MNARTANAVDVGTTGFEVVAATHHPHWDLVLGYTYLNKDADYGTTMVDASFYALNFARHRFTAAIVARLGGGFEMRMDNEYRIQEKNALRIIGGNEALLSGVGLYYLPPRWRGLELSFRMRQSLGQRFPGRAVRAVRPAAVDRGRDLPLVRPNSFDRVRSEPVITGPMDNPFLDRAFEIKWSRLTAADVEPAIDRAIADAESALSRHHGSPGGGGGLRQYLSRAGIGDGLAQRGVGEGFPSDQRGGLAGTAGRAQRRAAQSVGVPSQDSLNAALWQRIKAAAAHPSAAALRGEHRRFRDETLADFRQQGADLPADKKSRLEALQQELAQLTQKYSENVLDATNAWELVVSDPDRLRVCRIAPRKQPDRVH